MTVWYRAWTKVSLRSYFIDQDGEAVFSDRWEPKVDLYFDEFEVLRTTPTGVWLNTLDWSDHKQPERFVMRDSYKAFARSTKREAVLSLIERKKKHRKILASNIRSADAALARIDPDAPTFLTPV